MEEQYTDRVSKAMRFYLLATKLKYKIRSGWDSKHWNISGDRLESVAEHIYGTCILAIGLDSEFNLGIDLNKVIKMLVIHELGEVLIPDITPFDGITPEEKKQIEHEAFKEVLGSLVKADELYALFAEFDDHKSVEAKVAYYCDKLEADIQAKVYQDMGLQHDLNDQENNVVFNSSKAREMLKSATTSFDIWYEYDKDVYTDAPVFKRTLDYIKDNDTNI